MMDNINQTEKRRPYTGQRSTPAIYKKNINAQRRIDELTPEKRKFLEVCKQAMDPTPEGFMIFCEKLCGMRAHPGQVDVIRQMSEKDYGVLAAANGWGKTVFYALLVLWTGFSKAWAAPFLPQYKIAVMGPEMKQALLTHSEIEAIRFNRHAGQVWCNHSSPCGQGVKCPEAKKHSFLLGMWLEPFLTRDQHLAFKWTHNNSLINFESAKDKAQAIEGRAFNLIVYDEARLELWLKFIVEEVLLARGVRTENMKILLGSTPLADNFELLEYFNKGMRGDPDWWSRTGHIAENIFLSLKQVEKIRRNLDERVRDQVLAGMFVEPEEAYFVKERVENVFANEPEPTDLSSFSGKSIPGRTYVGGLDLAVSEGGDYSVLTIWDVTETPNRIIFERVFKKGTSASEVVNYCDVIIQEFAAQIGFDATGPLGVEFEHQVSHNLGWYVPVKFRTGTGTGSTAKPTVLANFRHFINNQLLKSPNIPGLKAQMIAYKVKDERLRKDRLMAQVYAAWIAKDYLTPEQIEGLKADLDATLYDGEFADPFFQIAPDDGKSELTKKYLNMVKMSRAGTV